MTSIEWVTFLFESYSVGDTSESWRVSAGHSMLVLSVKIALRLGLVGLSALPGNSVKVSFQFNYG